MKKTKKLMKGFACLAPARRAEIARMGGQAISCNRRHMAKIGAIGGSSKGAK